METHLSGRNPINNRNDLAACGATVDPTTIQISPDVTCKKCLDIIEGIK